MVDLVVMGMPHTADRRFYRLGGGLRQLVGLRDGFAWHHDGAKNHVGSRHALPYASNFQG